MLRRAFLLGAVLTSAAAIACNNDSVASGTAAEVIIRAFIDADGSGGFTTGDVAVPGTITLTGTGGATLQATIDASGKADFPSVMPGSYKASIGGLVPGGAILSTALNATVVLPDEGIDTSTDPNTVSVNNSDCVMSLWYSSTVQ